MTTQEKIKQLEAANDILRQSININIDRNHEVVDAIADLYKKKQYITVGLTALRNDYNENLEAIKQLKKETEYPKLVMVNATSVDLAINDRERIVLFKVKNCDYYSIHKIGNLYRTINSIGVGNDYQEGIILDNRTLNPNNQ